MSSQVYYRNMHNAFLINTEKLEDAELVLLFVIIVNFVEELLHMDTACKMHHIKICLV